MKDEEIYTPQIVIDVISANRANILLSFFTAPALNHVGLDRSDTRGITAIKIPICEGENPLRSKNCASNE